MFIEAVNQHGSPLWVIESSAFTENAQKFAGAFNRLFSDTAFYYAMKSNNHPRMSALALSSGCHMLQLTANRQRSEAVHFYERLGFVDSHHGLKLYLQD